MRQTNPLLAIYRTTAELVPGAASEPQVIERDALAWMEDGDRNAYAYDEHYLAAGGVDGIGMSLDEQRREAYASMRGLVVMMALAGIGFAVIVVAIYMQRTGGG